MILGRIQKILEEWEALPAGLRSWIIRSTHGICNILATGITTYQITNSWKDSLIVAAVSALGGQVSLSHQLPRNQETTPTQEDGPEGNNN